MGAGHGCGKALPAIAQRRSVARNDRPIKIASRRVGKFLEAKRDAVGRDSERARYADMHVVAAAFTQRVAAIARYSERLALLYSLAAAHNERAGRKMGVMTVLAVAVIDRNVIPER